MHVFKNRIVSFFYFKFCNATFQIIRSRVSCDLERKERKKENYFDHYHQVCQEFIDLAKEYYKKTLLKQQLKMLVEMNAIDSNLDEGLKNNIIKNFIVNSTQLFKKNVTFMIFHYLDRICLAPFDLKDEKGESRDGFCLISEMVGADEKMEKRKRESELKQREELKYSLFEMIIRQCEVFTII